MDKIFELMGEYQTILNEMNSDLDILLKEDKLNHKLKKILAFKLDDMCNSIKSTASIKTKNSDIRGIYFDVDKDSLELRNLLVGEQINYCNHLENHKNKIVKPDYISEMLRIKIEIPIKWESFCSISSFIRDEEIEQGYVEADIQFKRSIIYYSKGKRRDVAEERWYNEFNFFSKYLHDINNVCKLFIGTVFNTGGRWDKNILNRIIAGLKNYGGDALVMEFMECINEYVEPWGYKIDGCMDRFKSLKDFCL